MKVVATESTKFWVVTPYNVVQICHSFGRKNCFRRTGRRVNRVNIKKITRGTLLWFPVLGRNRVHGVHRPLAYFTSPGWWKITGVQQSVKWVEGELKDSEKTCPSAIPKYCINVCNSVKVSDKVSSFKICPQICYYHLLCKCWYVRRI
jgi:hypothetical protein